MIDNDEGVERAIATVDLSAIRDNVARLRSAAPNARLMAVVKADAYGHGMVPVARAARAAGVHWLGVALPQEALELRLSGDSGRLLTWLYPPGTDLDSLITADVDVSVSSAWALAEVLTAVTRTATPARIHLKIDTGLGRNGATARQWAAVVEAAAAAQRSGAVKIVGVWSHLACADEPGSAVTRAQLEAFTAAVGVARDAGLRPKLLHLASSGAALGEPDTHFDMVRCGISLYGLSPGPAMGRSADLGLTPAMTVTGHVALAKNVPAGQGVSYGLRYRTARPTRLALVPCGYADGVPRAGSGRLPITIVGVRHAAAGTIAMDQFVVDVGDHAVVAGDEVVLFGADPSGPTADDWADACGTINYEIVTRLGQRIPRRYVGGGE